MLSPLFGRIAVSEPRMYLWSVCVYDRENDLKPVGGTDELSRGIRYGPPSLDSTNETEETRYWDTDLNALLDKALETLTLQQQL